MKNIDSIISLLQEIDDEICDVVETLDEREFARSAAPASDDFDFGDAYHGLS